MAPGYANNNANSNAKQGMSARNNRLPSATMSAFSNGKQWTRFSRCIFSPCITSNITFHYFIFAGAIEIFGFIVLLFLLSSALRDALFTR
jgi:hypothetical protein